MRIIITSILFMISSSAALGAESIEVISPWVREVPPVSSVSAAYMIIKNNGDESDKLISASSNVSKFTEVHKTTIDENNVATMEVVDHLIIPAGEMIELEPGGSHIMLRELKSPLKAGDIVLIKLNFDKASTISIEAEVRQRPKAAYD